LSATNTFDFALFPDRSDPVPVFFFPLGWLDAVNLVALDPLSLSADLLLGASAIHLPQGESLLSLFFNQDLFSLE